MKTRTALLTALACLALPTAAGASPANDPGTPTFIPVADGKVEHSVWEARVTVPGKPEVVNRREEWIASDRQHGLGSSTSGERWEDAAFGSTYKTWSSRSPEVIQVRPMSSPKYFLQSVAGEAQIIREQLDAGILQLAEETTLDGRAVHVLVSGPADEAAKRGQEERLVVDATSYEALERGVTTPEVRAVNRRLTFELLDRTAEVEPQLHMREHAGAVEVGGGGDETATAAKRKAAAKKKKAAAKRRAAARKRAAAKRRAAAGRR